MSKVRLDARLVQDQLVPSLDLATAYILQGRVTVNGKKIDKCGTLVASDTPIQIRYPETTFVSRGGDKLKSAWAAFQFPIQDKTVLDVGISTGGFTDFALQNGAKLAIGIDVGYGQVAMKLQQNPNVILVERTNAKTLTAEQLKEAVVKQGYEANIVDQINLVVMDMSFISVTKVLPAIMSIVSHETQYIVLIKPQFESEKDEIEPGGVIKNPETVKAILNRVKTQLSDIGLSCLGECKSETKGAKKGNQEYFFWLQKTE